MAPSSSSSSSVCAHHVIVDSGGFISNAPIKDLSSNVYCVQDVVNEIKDKATKQRLQVLPYSINFREPSAESVSVVSAFAKKTGDYRSLSATDIRLIALTYQLEKEHAGVAHLRLDPPKKAESILIPSKRNQCQDSSIAGFYLGDLNKNHDKPTQKKKVVDDLINSLEKLKVAVEEVRTDFTLSPTYEGEQLTSNEKVYSSFNYWREPLLDLENLLDPSLLAPSETASISKSQPPSAGNRSSKVKPSLPPKPAHLSSSSSTSTSSSISPTRKSAAATSTSSSRGGGVDAVSTGADDVFRRSSTSGSVGGVGSGVDDVTSPDFDDFLYWKPDIILSPEEIDCMLLGGGEGEGSEGKREKERENEERRTRRRRRRRRWRRKSDRGEIWPGKPGRKMTQP